MRNLNDIEKTLTAIYALFDIQGGENGMVRRIVEELTGERLIDFKTALGSMAQKGYLKERRYDWRSDSYEYVMAEDKLIAAMIYFYEEEPTFIISVLEAARGIQPSVVQKMLWQYISSNYQNISIELISDYDIGKNLSIFVPVVTDNRFTPLIKVFRIENFSDLVKAFIYNAFASESIIDSAFLRQLISSYDTERMEYHHILQSLTRICDMYEYMAHGKKPDQLFSSYWEHHVIAGMQEAYQGQYKAALEHFKRAVTLNSKSAAGNFSMTKTYLPFSIINFYYVLIAVKTGNDDGRKKALTVAKAMESDVTMAAKLLHSILTHNVTEKQVRDRLNLLYSSGGMNRTLATLMCKYIGKEFSNNAIPQWLIIKHEMGAFEMSGQPISRYYGEIQILNSIYHRKAWETVLEDLGGMTNIDHPDNAKKDVRIGYFMRNTKSHDVQVRLQSTLKNGGWGAGKQLGISNFINHDTEGMTDADRRIKATEIAAGNDGCHQQAVRLTSVLPEMANESRLYVGRYAPFTLVEVTEEMPYITLHHDRDGFLITSNVNPSEVEEEIIITHRGTASINFIRLTNQQRPYYRRLLSIERFPNEAEAKLRKFLNGLGGQIEVHSDLIEGGSTLPITDGNAQLTMQMRPDNTKRGGEAMYSVSFFVRPLQNGRIRCIPGDGNDVIVDTGIVATGKEGESKENKAETAMVRTRVRRDKEKEMENFNHLFDSLHEEIDDLSSLTADTPLSLPAYDILLLIEYAQHNPDRIVCEWPEGAQMRIKHRNTAMSWQGAITKTDNGWFEIEGNVELDQGKVISMAQLLELANQSHGRFITLGNGDFLALSDKLRKQLDQLNAIASRHHGRLQMSPFSAALLGPDVLEGEMAISLDQEMQAIRRRILESSTYTPEVPASLNATLRHYQLEGYQWISRLNKWGAGALLADDMGLGKTIQTIAFLLSKASKGPSLVVAPASVAPNWKVEFDKFAPSLNVTMLNYETDRDEAIRRAKAGDVVVCTYMLLLSVKTEIVSKQWSTICLDEAHIIKNRGAKTSAIAMKLKSENRIMLTGTPVQNHLGELWNLFQFVNPGLLGSFEDFNRRFIIPIEQNKDKVTQRQLDKLVKPFMLRRTKDKVATELPEKEEIYQHVQMNEEEQLTYEALRQHAEAMLIESGMGSVSMNTLAEITRLRLCACCTSKVTAMLELLQTVLDDNDANSALIFSQFTTYLTTIREALDQAGIPYLYIDGTVHIKERQRMVEEFQNGKCPVFLISLKAGGLGLNLTRANYVIHMDPWWNPAIEAQATDRAHRIGQKRAVTVYHLISEGTIEEKIQRLHERKQALVENILEATDASHKLTGEELLEMIRA